VTRAVLFDLGNTLVSYYTTSDFLPVLRQSVLECMRILPPQWHLDEDRLLQKAQALNVERSDHAVWPLAERLAVLFGCEIFPSALQERLTAAFLNPIFATAVPDPAALSVLAALRAARVSTAIVSNTPWGSPAAPWRAELARHHLLTAVDAVVFCADVGHRKPHHAPFERALTLLGLHAADAIFVGDDPCWDVAGAQQVGMQPLLLTRGLPGPDTIPCARNLLEVLEYVTASLHRQA
jgi:HAD superfamily hydrolase (TIGR01509 family)